MNVRCALGLAASIALPALSATTAHAQADRAASCIDVIPASAFQRTLVYLTPREPATSSAAARMRGDEFALFAQSVAQRTRALIGGTADRAVEADTTLSWKDLGTDVNVTIAPDGSYRWSTGDVTAIMRRGTRGAALLGRAIDSLIAEKEVFFHADNASSDSVHLGLAFETPVRHADGNVTPLQLAVAIPVATILEPWSEPAHPTGPPLTARSRPKQRDDVESMRIVLSYLVDTTGHTDPSSVKVQSVEISPSDTPESYVAERVAMMRDVAERTSFVPARLGGCVVPELVRQSLTGGSDKLYRWVPRRE